MDRTAAVVAREDRARVTPGWTSILSFPERGPWGDARYRGNCSGHVVHRLLDVYRPHLVVDPAEGSGTTGDVCRERAVDYVGLDLRDGFDVVREPLRSRLPRPADLVFFHPPYWNIIPYSGSAWGDRPDPRDLSHAPTYEAYLADLRRAVVNCLDALAPGGRLAILIGDIRRAGRYYSAQAAIIGWNLAPLDAVWIKVQHHVASDGVRYDHEERLVRIAHEYVIVLRSGN